MIHRTAGTVFAAALLTLMLHGVLPAAETASLENAKSAPAALPAESIPFFHTYNLTALFPVGAATMGQSGGGAQVLTLDDCIDRALAGNPAHANARR
jgi:hypothetical protein